MKQNSQRGKMLNFPTGASIRRLSATTQQPVEIKKRSSSSSERSEECIETIEAR
jgi:hypothetical protein